MKRAKKRAKRRARRPTALDALIAKIDKLPRQLAYQYVTPPPAPPPAPKTREQELEERLAAAEWSRGIAIDARAQIEQRLAGMLNKSQREIALLTCGEVEYALNLLRLYKAKVEQGLYRDEQHGRDHH